MRLSFSGTIELDDEEVLQILASVDSEHLSDVPEAAVDPARHSVGPREAEVEFPSEWQFVEDRDGETYQWPDGNPPEKYASFSVYEGRTARGTIRMGIGRCERSQTWGRNRTYLITFYMTAGGKRPLCEFLETDDYQETRELIAVVRGNGALQRSMYGPSQVLPLAYRHLRDHIVVYSDRIAFKGAWNKQAIVAHEEDVDTMLGHSLIQAEYRFGIKPS